MIKVTSRIWILGIVLAISIISIINTTSGNKLLILLLIIGCFAAPSFTKTNKAAVTIILLFLATGSFLIFSSLETGILVKSIEKDSELFNQGLRQGDIITALNGEEILTLKDYSSKMEELFNENAEQRIDIVTKNNEYIIFADAPPKITIQKISKTNIKTGLDISGGARALIKPEGEISDQELDDLIEISRNRFNVFGISDIKTKAVKDLDGNKYMLVEVAGATPDDLEDLLSKQGKFEARINDETVFIGGERDITNVCRNDATCAGITSCSQLTGGYSCSFAFTIYLTEEAAERHADITREIPINFETGGQYLMANLTLVLDDEPVDTLLISKGLRGQVTTQISIQGSGQGQTREEAFQDAQESMKHLQTILITGSLPYKLEIVKLDKISPALGNQFVFLVFLAGGSSILLTSLIIFVRYKKLKISLALLMTAFSELIIILGIASFIKWNLDLPSIAGILATIGTGVDQQIVILDEARTSKEINMGRRMKRALFVVMTAYITSLFALLPLYWAGAGLFKGFAITTIIGITAGVFITRPAFADIIKRIEE